MLEKSVSNFFFFNKIPLKTWSSMRDSVHYDKVLTGTQSSEHGAYSSRTLTEAWSSQGTELAATDSSQEFPGTGLNSFYLQYFEFCW